MSAYFIMSSVNRILFSNGADLAERELVRDVLLKGSEFQMVEVESWSDLAGRIAESGFEAVLTDLEIFGMKKTEMIGRIRALNSRLPIVVVTRAENEALALASLEKGAADYEIKMRPRIERLPYALHGAIRRSKLHDSSLEEELAAVKRELAEERDNAEAQLAAAAKEFELFAYSVSHDLRAPLRAIEGFSRILADDYAPQLDDEAKRCLGIVTASAEQMMRLIEAVLAFSRINQAPVNKETVNMAELARTGVAEASQAGKDRQIQFQIGELLPAYADLSLTRKAFTQLIANAVKFTRPKPQAVVEIGSYREGNENVYYVRDNGVGFDPHYAGKLFGMFQRLHRAEEFEGIGSGLAMVRRIFQRQGGRTWAEAKVNEGATFYFALPQASAV